MDYGKPGGYAESPPKAKPPQEAMMNAPQLQKHSQGSGHPPMSTPEGTPEGMSRPSNTNQAKLPSNPSNTYADSSERTYSKCKKQTSLENTGITEMSADGYVVIDL